MTTKEKLIEMLVANGMFDSQAEKVMEAAIPQLDPQITWHRPASDYPEPMFAVLFLMVKPFALAWIEQNAPMAWFKPMFQDVDFDAIKEDSEDLRTLVSVEMDDNIRGAHNVSKKAKQLPISSEAITMESFVEVLEKSAAKSNKSIIRVDSVADAASYLANQEWKSKDEMGVSGGQPWEPSSLVPLKTRGKRLKVVAKHK